MFQDAYIVLYKLKRKPAHPVVCGVLCSLLPFAVWGKTKQVGGVGPDLWSGAMDVSSGLCPRVAHEGGQLARGP